MSESKGQSRLRWAAAALASIASAILVCVAGGAFYAARLHAGRREALDAKLVALRARGEPVGSDDVVLADVPPGDDGGPALRAAWAWLEAHEADADASWEEGGHSLRELAALPAGRLEQVRAAMRELAPWRDMVAQAVAHPRWRALEPADGQALIAQTLVEIRPIQETTRLLRLSLATLPADASSADRMRLLGALARLVTRWEAPRTTVERLVVTSVQGTVLEDMRVLLELGRVEPADVRRELADILDADIRAAADRTLQLERAACIDAVRRVVGDDPRPVAADGSLPVLGEGWSARLARDSLIDYIDETSALLATDDRSWRWLGRRTSELRAGRTPPPWRLDVGSRAAGASWTILSKLVAAATRLAAQQRLALCALAALSHRAGTGTWPPDLSALDVPDAVRTDPFTDRDLVYELLPDGALRIASVGRTDAEIWGVEENDPDGEGLVWTLR